MPRHLIKSWLPDPRRIRENQALKLLGTRLQQPALWHLNRRSVAGGLAVGVFCALIPLPFQMLIAAFLAVLFRVNLPLSAVTVWITNPITIPAVFYTTYRFGAWLLDSRPLNLKFRLSAEWLSYNLDIIWQPLILGSVTLGILLAGITYAGVSLAWRWYVVAARRERLSLGRRKRLKRPSRSGKRTVRPDRPL